MFHIYYAMIIRGAEGSSACETRFFTGYNRAVIRSVLSGLTRDTTGLRYCHWCVYDFQGKALEGRHWERFRPRGWKNIPKSALVNYNLSQGLFYLAQMSCDTIQDDFSVTENIPGKNPVNNIETTS